MHRLDLTPDCGRCAAICCVATSFDASEWFAFDKPAGEPCPNLGQDHRCGIHPELRERGFAGCAAYDCYGAGQRATRVAAELPPSERDQVFLALRTVHETLWLLTAARALCPPSEAKLAADLLREADTLDALAEADPRGDGLEPQLARARRLLRAVGTALGGRRQVRSLPVLGRLAPKGALAGDGTRPGEQAAEQAPRPFWGGQAGDGI